MVSIQEVLLKAQDIKVHFPVRGGVFSRIQGFVKAVDGVSLSIREGESLGLVGESGCGKSTLGRAILRLIEPTAGEVHFRNQQILNLSQSEMKPLRRQMQIIFQDPYSALDPRMSIERILAEPFVIHGIGRNQLREQAIELLRLVGLRETDLHKYPHEFSGGQRQRIGIARAIALKPQLIVADEPIAALDVSIQAQIINLLADLKSRLKLTFLFISHDLSVVRYFCERIAVMYLGKIVELTTSDQLIALPIHPYSKALLSSVLPGNLEEKSKLKRREVLTGDVPSPLTPPSGCAFHPRCKFARARCRDEVPVLRQILVESTPHWVSCHLAEEIKEMKL